MSEPADGLVLVGLPASGKSTVGRHVARGLGRRFIDTDALIAVRTGVPAAAYLRDHGEPAFRVVERQAVMAACTERGAVVATGGGALSDPLNRWQLWSHGRVVWLNASAEVLLARLAADGNPRPLLEAGGSRRLAVLAEQRAPFYRAADVVVEAEARPESVADAVQHSITAPAPVGRRLYDALEPRHHPIGPAVARIVLGHDLGADTYGEVLAAIGGTASLVADRHAHAELRDLPVPRRLEIVAGERVKGMAAVARILCWLARGGAERGDPVIGLGGGTLTDLVGLAAALHLRGVPFVAVPTTWLGQADAALGGKVAVNLPGAKNAVGAFWPASGVIADIAALRTLPAVRLRDGMAEALKAGIIGDGTLWELATRHGPAALAGDEALRYAITEHAARLKLTIVRRDPFEVGERRQLNLGHTVAHALEVESGYRLAHGAAVGLGLRAAACLAELRGGDPNLGCALDKALAMLRLPLRRRFDPMAVRSALQGDKKRANGRQRWLLPMAVGQVVEVDDVSDVELEAALRRIAAVD